MLIFQLKIDTFPILIFRFFLKINRVEAIDEMDKLEVSRKSDQKCRLHTVKQEKDKWTDGRTT